MKKLLILILVLVMGINISYSSEDINIYVLPAVFKSQNIKNAVFEDIFKENNRYFINLFVDKFKEAYPNTTSEITETNKHKTFVAYLNLPRVSQQNIGELSVKAYIPMTATLSFANLATSEILYSESITERMKYSTSEQNAKSATKMLEPYKKVYSDVVSHIIKNAKEQFKPFSIDVKVVDKYKNLYILDKHF